MSWANCCSRAKTPGAGVTIALGIAGAFVGGFLGSFFGLGSVGGGINLGSIATATVGAIVLLVIYRQIKR